MRRLLMAFLMLGIASCASAPLPIEFCGIGTGNKEPRDSLVFNIQERTLKRGGALYQYVPLESETAKGFVVPFPLTLPKREFLSKDSTKLTNEDIQWEFDGYSFRMTPLAAGSSDWVLIDSQPVATRKSVANEIVWHTSVLYSVSDGVLAIRAVSDHGGERSASAAFSCGTSALHASSF